MTREISRLFSFHFFHFKGFLTSFEMTVQLLFVDGVGLGGGSRANPRRISHIKDNCHFERSEKSQQNNFHASESKLIPAKSVTLRF